MRKSVIACASLVALVTLPTIASAQEGAAAGAATGAIAGGVIGGPVGAAVGAAVGGTAGAASDAARTTGSVVAPAPGAVVVEPGPTARERTCVIDTATGVQRCTEVVR